MIWRITETDASETVSEVTFTYDRLSRLVREERFIPATSTVVYDLEYTYDKLGNRQEKRDLLNDVTTFYHYDVDADQAGLFASHHNRLQYAETYAVDALGDPVGYPLEQVMYLYDAGGNPEMIVRRPGDGEEPYYLTRFTYDASGRAWLLEQWMYDTELVGDPPEEVVLPSSVLLIVCRGGRRGPWRSS